MICNAKRSYRETPKVHPDKCLPRMELSMPKYPENPTHNLLSWNAAWLCFWRRKQHKDLPREVAKRCEKKRENMQIPAECSMRSSVQGQACDANPNGTQHESASRSNLVGPMERNKACAQYTGSFVPSRESNAQVLLFREKQ